MSPRLWVISRRSRSRHLRPPWWLYVTSCGVLIWAGVKVAQWGSGILPGGLGWIPWVIFGAWWIPTSLGISKWLAAGTAQLFALPARLLSPPEHPSSERIVQGTKLVQCPHCGAEVEADRAICSHCYQDLKRNCPTCGTITSINTERCPQCNAPLIVSNPAKG